LFSVFLNGLKTFTTAIKGLINNIEVYNIYDHIKINMGYNNERNYFNHENEYKINADYYENEKDNNKKDTTGSQKNIDKIRYLDNNAHLCSIYYRNSRHPHEKEIKNTNKRNICRLSKKIGYDDVWKSVQNILRFE